MDEPVPHSSGQGNQADSPNISPSPAAFRPSDRPAAPPDFTRPPAHGQPPPHHPPAGAQYNHRSFPFPVDPFRLLTALRRRCLRIFACAALFFLAGVAWIASTHRFTAQATLIPTESPEFLSTRLESAPLKSQLPSRETLLDLLRAPEVLKEVAAIAPASFNYQDLVDHTEIAVVADTELIRVIYKALDQRKAVQTANLIADKAVKRTREFRAKNAEETDSILEDKLLATEIELNQASQELTQFQQANGLIDFEQETSAYLQQRSDLSKRADDLKLQMDTLETQVQTLLQEIAKQNPALIAAKESLDKALLRFTEDHPRVKELRGAIQSMENQIAGQKLNEVIASHGNSMANTLYLQVVDLRSKKISLAKQLEGVASLKNQLESKLAEFSSKSLEFGKFQGRFQTLKRNRDLLYDRREAMRLNQENNPGYYKILAEAKMDPLAAAQKWTAAGMFGLNLAIIGLLASILITLGIEVADRRIRTPADLSRVTKLPVLAALGDLNLMTLEEQDQWAFKTLTLLKGKNQAFNRSPLLFGFTSSTRSEGRSTWVNLLSEAAAKSGYRVLTISIEDMSPYPSPAEETPAANDGGAPETNALTTHITGKLMAPSSQSQPITRITLPGSVWNLERRDQWKQALHQWSSIPNLALFVDLPPASMPETALLSENLSKIIWLCGEDMAKSADTKSQLQLLEWSGANVAGAVFNRASHSSWKKQLAPVLSGLALIAGLLFPLAQPQTATAAEPLPPTTVSPTGVPQNRGPGAFSVSSPRQLAAWQKNLTLGPGDVLDVQLYEIPDSLRVGVFIGPDGRLNYLQARDVMAAGLTVDELRTQLEDVLGKDYLSPRVVIIPKAYNSKRYYLLGNVVQKGVFPLDRPVTIIEAIAKAQGFANTVQQRNTLLLADLSRSFLMRKTDGGTFSKLPVDFEGLFLRGDLSQNQQLAPDDYLYFPPLDLQEIYVLGEVPAPGVAPFTPNLTVLRAIISRGGFTERSYRKKVLVVRGSLSRPQTFIVNVDDTLAAKTTDFKLEPRDIIYVSRKPWFKAEELLEAAVFDFMRSAVITWTGQNVGPFITDPLF